MHFTGRDAALEEIHRLLQPGVPVALTGTPGIGKTDTAVEYVYRHYFGKNCVYWVNADTPENINLGFADIARRLHLPLDVNAKSALINAAVKRSLAEQNGWLLVFNNVESASHAAGYYPPGSTGFLLLTTRSDKTENAAKSVSLEPMTPDEGACLVLRRANILGEHDPLDQADAADQKAAKAINEKLGGLPLALDQAGGYMDSFDCGAEDIFSFTPETANPTAANRRTRTTRSARRSLQPSRWRYGKWPKPTMPPPICYTCVRFSPPTTSRRRYSPGTTPIWGNISPQWSQAWAISGKSPQPLFALPSCAQTARPSADRASSRAGCHQRPFERG